MSNLRTVLAVRSVDSHKAHRLDRSCAAASKQNNVARPPALFTEAQAESGKQKFEEHCSFCHGSSLAGRAGPALKGPHFAPVKADFHVGDIFGIVSKNMPATEPGSLPHEDYVEIMAFILQQNGYPAGDNALTFEEATESKVRLLYYGE